MTSFQKDLEDLINRHSMENTSDTPDFILARYMNDCLQAFERAVVRREQWYARKEYPKCRTCGKSLIPENFRIADGCPCNSGRGVNHGLVARDTCTCPVCDPAQTGSTRYLTEEG